jgi:hypothetical protein
MNTLERKMVDVLTDLKENHGVIGVKAEFEAEGTRIEEALRLKEVLMKVGLGLTLKIGGCEAIRDIYEARVIGVSRIVAPMVESAYALSKFIGAIKLTVPQDERKDLSFAVNIETQEACSRFDEMLRVPGVENLDCIVIGRVDLCGSMGMDRASINSEEVTNVFRPVLEKAKAREFETAMGGAISAHSIPVFKSLGDKLDKFETRKVVFKHETALAKSPEHGLLKAVEFELLWLKNKRDFYGQIFAEDDQRIGMLEARYRKTMDLMGISA